MKYNKLEKSIGALTIVAGIFAILFNIALVGGAVWVVWKLLLHFGVI